MPGRSGFRWGLFLLLCGCGAAAPTGADPGESLDPARAAARALLAGAASGAVDVTEQPAGAPLLRALLGDDSLRLDLASRAASLADFLDSLTDPSTLERQTDRERVYRVRTATLCGDGSRCGSALASHAVRAVATSPGSGSIDLALTVDDVLACTFHLRPDELSLDTDLSVAARALWLLRGTPASGSGRVSISLSRTAVGFHLRGSAQDSLTFDDGFLAMSLAPADPFADLAFGGAGASLSLSSGPVEVGLPLGRVLSCRSCSDGHRLGVRVEGLTGLLRLAGPGSTADALGLGNGPAHVFLDGIDVLTLDLNGMHGRTLTAVVDCDEHEADLTVDHAFDLDAQLALEPLQRAGVQVPDWALHDHLQMSFDGSPAPALTLVLHPEPGQPILQVNQGALSLSSRDDQLVVDAPRCLLGPGDGTGPFSGMRAAICP